MQIQTRFVAMTLAAAPVLFHSVSVAQIDPGPFRVVALDLEGGAMDWEDVNGDLVPDAAIRTADLLRLYLLNADGSIEETVDVTGIPYSNSEDAYVYADLTGDGIDDVAVLRFDELEIYPGQGVGSGTGNGASGWGPPEVIDLGVIPEMLLPADTDGDGDLDLFVGGTRSIGVHELLNDGTGGFAAPARITPTNPQSFFLTDLNGDGAPDLVWVRDGSSQCFVRLNDGAGLQGPATSYTIGFNGASPLPNVMSQIVSADLDGDGDADLAVANSRHSDVSVLLNDGAGGFVVDGTYDAAYWNHFLTSGDIDDDGDIDLISCGPSTGSSTPMVSTLLRNNGDAAFAGEPWFDADQNGFIAPVDVDGDGDLDLLYEQDGPCAVINNGGLPSPPVLHDKSGSQFIRPTLVSGDLNGDGLIDLVTEDDNRHLYVSLQQADGAFSRRREFTDSVSVVHDVGDIDGDGDLDILGSYLSAMQTFANDGDGTFGSTRRFTGMSAPPTVLADMDGDGDLDGVGSSNTAITIMRNSGTGTFARVYDEPVTHVGGGVAPTAVFDADGDGRLDIARWFYDGTTTFVGVWLNIGTWTFTPEVLSPVGVLPIQRVAIADLNGDGALDVVTLAFGSGSVEVLRNTGGGTFMVDRVVPNEGIRFSPTLADFDGDGDLDFAGMTTAGSRVIVLDNRGDADFGDPFRIPAGQSGVGLIIDDLNNDGSTDLLSDYSKGGQFLGGAISVRYGTAAEPTGCNAADLADPLGVLDLGDIGVFVDAFLDGGAAADLAVPFGTLDLADISVFITAFTAGCP